MRKLLFFLLVFVTVSNPKAQIVSLIQATKQHWIGGTGCSSGTNFVISLESTDTLHFITIDTVWIGNKFFTKNSFLVFNNLLNGKMAYQIMVSDRRNKYDLPDLMDKKEPPVLTLIYNGEACVVYHDKKKRRLMPVNSFVELAPIDYP